MQLAKFKITNGKSYGKTYGAEHSGCLFELGTAG